MIELLSLNLNSWIIQDGNYGDFSVGDSGALAVEFYPLSGLESSPPAEIGWGAR